MANKAISELPQAENVNNQDLFVLEQGGLAKKLTAETFITEQGIIDALAEALDGHGGIQSVTLQSLSGRVRTYLITFSDGSATTFQVLDGSTITNIQKTSTAGLVDTYTVYMSDGTTTFFQVRNGQDGSATWDQINSKAPIITDTVTGAIANFPDGADDIPVADLVVNIEPKQSGSGDPSPSNIRPISGWTGVNAYRTGKNLLPKMTGVTNVNGLTSVVNADGSLTVTGTATGTGGYITEWVNLATTIAPQTYITVSTTTNVPAKLRCFWDDATADIQSGSNYTTRAFSSALTKVRLYLFTTANTSYNFTIYPQVELGSTATAYEPYITPSTVSLSWQTEAGTVYGGSLDVTTGVLTVDRVINTRLLNTFYLLDTLTNTKHYRYAGDFFGAGTGKVENNSSAICNIATQAYNSTDTIHFYMSWHTGNSENRVELWLPTETPTDTSVQISAKLLAPQTYQLTPQEVKTLLGTNNVWADTGDTTVTYAADTKLYIEKLTMPTEDDMTANQAITSGKFFMVGNNLYIATAAIASGAKIIEGTNATRLSLADALNRL